MRLIKSNKIGYLQRSYGIAKNYFYVASPVMFFDLLSGEILVENTQWGKVAKALGKEALDHGLPKTTGEFLLAGQAYPQPDECPELGEMTVSTKLGDCCKSLRVFGKRHWRRSWLGGKVPSCPEEVTVTPLTFELAYGGEAYKPNPLGTGFDGLTPPPSVEQIETLVGRPGKKRQPASYLPLPITWPQRSRYEGNYKGNWFETSFPAMPADTNRRLFDAAPADQQSPGFFNGDEDYQLTNLHREYPEISGRLPGVSLRLFVKRHGELQELKTVLDTVLVYARARPWGARIQSRNASGKYGVTGNNRCADWL